MSTTRRTRSTKSLRHLLTALFVVVIAVSGIWLLAGAGHAATTHPAPLDAGSHDATAIDAPAHHAIWEPSQRSSGSTPVASTPSHLDVAPTAVSAPRLDDRAPSFPARPLYLLCCVLLN